ncbi:tripartite tricarboxylate transporter substrate binding protein [Piscinibacter sp.]|uniref:tripartite tricarboxylate transporter substrate binding protein n=1 Tax=Piscinibacter sp. TaxID=1903157 RepID=UPI002B9CBD1E|nr:tripartite tricarboxylate transporter substrate binding protein [Albitalea sp.]HUG22698.1 tripartite tricarboxylate transporter substrate binding protein [Albitalea sp.]
MQRRHFLPAAAAASLGSLAAPLVFGQGTTVRLVVGFPPGGGADALGRLIAAKLTTLWKRQVIVENRAGASGTLAANEVAKAPADGSALLLTTINSHALAPAVQPRMRYHAERDFTPVALLGVTPNLLVTAASNPAKSLKDVVALAKAQPGTVPFGSAGPGTIQHFAIEKFKLLGQLDVLHVPYKGSAPLITDLVGGQIQFAFETMTAATPHVNSGRLVALAQTRGKRSPAYPAVPTMQEQGFAGFETMNWYGISGPAKLPAALVQQINQDVNAVLGMADVQRQLEVFGVEDGGGTAEDFAKFQSAEIAKWAKVAKEAKVTIDG